MAAVHALWGVLAVPESPVVPPGIAAAASAIPGAPATSAAATGG